MKMLKSAARLAVIALLAGVFLTYAMAWGCAIWTPLAPPPTNIVYQTFPAGGDRVAWPHPVPGGWPAKCSQVKEEHLFGISSFTARWFQNGMGPAEYSQVAFLAGWPFRGLIAVESAGPFSPAGRDGGAGSHVVSSPRLSVPAWLPWAASPGRFLPLTPRWPGFIADTLVFAAAVAAPFIPRGVIRAWRRRRGRCQRCGHILQDVPTCPECGTPAP